MKLPAVSETELAILQVLWEHGRLTARQITERLYPSQTASDVATVQKLVQRLQAKKLVGRDRTLFVHVLYPLVDRNEFAAQQLAEAAHKLTSGSLKPLLTHLVETDQLSPEEQDEIRRLLERHRKKRT